MVSIMRRPSGAEGRMDGEVTLETVLICDGCGQPIAGLQGNVVFSVGSKPLAPMRFDIVHKTCDDDTYLSSIELAEFVGQLARRHLTRQQLESLSRNFINP